MTALVFLAAFAAYLYNAYPWLAPRDAGDLAYAASTLGVSHAPGYPLHALLGRGFEMMIPFGHPAWRLSLVSAVAAAAAAAMLFAWARNRAGMWAGLTAAVVLASSAPVWKFALLQEKYALHVLFMVASVVLAEGESLSVWSRARLSGLLFGLAIVNHQSFLFWLPLPLLIWHAEAKKHDVDFLSLFKAALPWSLAGLSLTLYTAIRCEPGTFWDTVLRKRYGTASLFAGYQKPFELAMPGLLGWFARNLAVPASLIAAYGWWKEEKKLAWAAGLGGAVLFLLLTRFDVTGWAARSALEPAFLGPAVIIAVLSGLAVSSLPPKAHPFVPLALSLSAPFVVGHQGHRMDMLAYDYVRDLRRAVPPGSALLASGDTASFGLVYDGLSSPLGFELGHARMVDVARWASARQGKTLYVTGMNFAQLSALGLPIKGYTPMGLVQQAGPGFAVPMAFRRSARWGGADSYSRDVLFSYAFASYISARLYEAAGHPSPASDLQAVSLDPEDYRWE